MRIRPYKTYNKLRLSNESWSSKVGSDTRKIVQLLYFNNRGS